MQTSLKLKLLSLAVAAAVVAGAASFVPAVAEDAPAMPAKTVELKDGSKLTVEGDNVVVVSADGAATPAPDGDHVAKDGSVLKTKGGKLVK